MTVPVPVTRPCASLSLYINHCPQRVVEESPLPITRSNALLGTPLPWGAPEGVRAGAQDLYALLTAYQGSPYPPPPPSAPSLAPRRLLGVHWPPHPPSRVAVTDSGAHRLARGCIFCTENLTDTVDGWLLDRWHRNEPVYDAMFLHDVHAVLEVRDGGALLVGVVCANCRSVVG